MNTKLRETTEVPGYAAKLVENKKFYADKASERPVARIHGGLHTLIPFAVEDGGRLGAHAQAFLHTLAERAVRLGRRSRAQLRDPGGDVSRGDGRPKCLCGSRDGSDTSPPGYTSPCLGSF